MEEEDQHIVIIEQDGSMTDGGLKSYQHEPAYDLPHETTDDVDRLCLLLESRLI